MKFFYDGAFPYVSYITESGDEIILASEEINRYWVTYKRKGFDGPPLRTEKRQYADGTTEILAIFMKERPLTLSMVAMGKTSMERDAIISNIVSRITQLGTGRKWGKLKVCTNDGRFLFIDCAYTGGLENANRVFPRIQQFDLNFLSGNGYFYDAEETSISTRAIENLVYLSDDLYLSNLLYLTDGISSIVIENTGEEFYPIVEISGPASVIKIKNSATNKTLAVDPDFHILSGEKLIFDCIEHEQSITYEDENGVITDVTDKLTLGSSLVWEILKGQNAIEFTFSDGDTDTSATIRYRQRYLNA